MGASTGLGHVHMIINSNDLIRALQDAARYGDIKAAAFLPMLLDWARDIPVQHH